MEHSGSYRGVVICDDELCSDSSDEQTDVSIYSDSEESIEAPPYSPVTMDGTDSGDEDLDIVLSEANESCKNC